MVNDAQRIYLNHTIISFVLGWQLLCSGLEAGELYQIGGTGEHSWSASGNIEGFTEQDGSIRLTVIDSTENLAQRSSVSFPNRPSLRNTEENLTGWLTDGDPSTTWEMRAQANGAIMEIDLGMSLLVYRIVLRCHDNDFPRAYEISVNDGLNLDSLGNPIWNRYVVENHNEEAVIDLTFPTRRVRYIRFVNMGPMPFAISDIDIRGMGVVPFGSFLSRVIDLGNNAIFGPIRFVARFDDNVRVLFRTRTGSVPDANVYYRIVGDSEEAIQPVGTEEAKRNV